MIINFRIHKINRPNIYIIKKKKTKLCDIRWKKKAPLNKNCSFLKWAALA